MKTKEELIRAFKTKLLRKNQGRRYHFLDLKINEIEEVISEYFNDTKIKGEENDNRSKM